METLQKPPAGKKTKARAPPPPQPIPKHHMEHMSSTDSDGTGNQSTEESKENVLHRKVNITVCFPDGQEKIINVDGSKAVMDFLVELCSQHHLNPAQHTLEARSGASQQPFLLRPNTLIGTLDLQTIFLKEKVTEVKVKKPAPKIPEKTVRLIVNYLGTQKAVVRVNPEVPLWNILPAVCEKCEFHHENVTLLRDAISREELDMSQSLNDLGVKELYAWNNKQEKNRKLSSSSDTAEKEKKGVLGFFRSHKKGNKNETAIRRMDSDEYEEIFQTASTSGNRCEGFSTAPSSPSVNSRSIAFGASLSLSNISGIGARTEVKKRRAPPPPKPAPPIIATVKAPEEKVPEPLYATVQKEQQKKKRRAPPPPPTPQMPNEKNEDPEKRKSSISNGRQVPQKPPRGTSRSPPQLEIPPPPPYPPPDNDITDSPIFENGAAITGTTKPIPAKRGKILTRSSSITSEEVLTTDDTVSVNSYTEDSGVVSSPSDSVSLDLQTDSYKKSENTNHNANLEPARAESFNSDDSWSLKKSSTQIKDEVTSVQNGDEDIFITTQFQDTLAELDEDSEDMDDTSHNESHISARSSPVGQESSQFHEDKESGATIPVTIIDEIPQVTTYTVKNNTLPPVIDFNEMQKSPSEINKTSESFNSGESVARKTYTPPSSASSPTSLTVKPIGGSFKQSTDISKQQTSSQYISTVSDRPKSVIESPSSNPPVSTFPIKMEKESKPVKDKASVLPDNRQNVVIKENQAPQNNTKKAAESTKPTLWRQQTYEPKVGMTTFTVVPPKPAVKKYDRGVSLTSSAIKIDDQGNLISPQSSFDKSDSFTTDKESQLAEKPLVARAKEFWRSSSMDAQGGELKEQPVKKIGVVKNYKPNEAVEKRAMFMSSKGLTQQMPANKINEKHNTLQQNKPITTQHVPQENVIIIENTVKKTDIAPLRPTLNDKQRQTIETSKGKFDQGPAISDKIRGPQQTKPDLLSTTSQDKVIIIEKNQEKQELLFLKPAKRTSSQYVASAIFKHTEPSNRRSVDTTEFKLDTNSNRSSAFIMSSIKKNANVTQEQPKQEIKSEPKKETCTELNANLGHKDGQLTSKMQTNNKISHPWQAPSETKKDDLLLRKQQFNGPANGNITVIEKTEKNAVLETTRIRPTSNVPSNAFLKAVREKSMKIEQENAFVPKKAPTAGVTIIEKENKSEVDTIPSTIIDEPDSMGSNNVFGPKAKFRPVFQKPVQKDTSLHSALMGAIQSGEGKEKLRKIQSSPTDGGEKTLCEPENERSALLSAIRAHNGISRLKKVSSAASNELQSIRKAEDESSAANTLSIPPSPLMPPPPPPTLASAPKSSLSQVMPPPLPPTLGSAPKSPPVFTNNSVDAREALLDAIRSGQGASKLKKVSASVRTL